MSYAHPLELLKSIVGQALGDLPLMAALSAVNLISPYAYNIVSPWVPGGLQQPFGAVYQALLTTLGFIIYKEIGM